MKTFKIYLGAFFIMALGMLNFSCSDNDDPKPDVTPDPLETAHFDIWVSIGGSGGMGSTNAQLVKGVKSLEEQETIDFKGTGADVTAKLFMESIIKGQYYYEVPREKDRFGKYKITDKGIEIVKEFSFNKNTLKDRRYSHLWVDENTLVLIAANGDASKVIWIKVDAANMKIMSEGELNLPELPEGGVYSTSGIASYRTADKKILYSYLNNKDKTRFFMAFINPETMEVESTVTEDRAEFMAGTAYGQLLQSKSFFTPNGDYYLACNTKIPGSPGSTQQFGTLLRIKKGAKEFDKSYLGFRSGSGSKGKIITAECLNDTKALLYVMDPELTGAGGWGSDYNCYYAVLDLQTDKLTILDMPFSEGNFSQRSVVLGDKAYIGVNPESSAPCVYIYDITNGSLTKGLKITEGYSFDRIVVLAD